MTARTPAIATVKIDEPHVRVTEYRFTQGSETGWHRHEADYVILPITDGDLLIENPDGSTRTVTLKANEPYTGREGTAHNVVAAGDRPFAFFEIEILRKG